VSSDPGKGGWLTLSSDDFEAELDCVQKISITIGSRYEETFRTVAWFYAVMYILTLKSYAS
jgi:hypothetical protein